MKPDAAPSPGTDYGPAPHGVSWSEEGFQDLCRVTRATVEALTGRRFRWINDPAGMQVYLEAPHA
jgi:hypothetical protein